MKEVKPKKYLGQHFLKDFDIAQRIANTVDTHSDIHWIEIGPGMGILTQFLLKKKLNLDVIEIDKESVAYLHETFPSLSGHIKEQDFLKMMISDINTPLSPMGIIGNYPYNISSQIFFKVLDWKDCVQVCSGMLQYEVAKRLASPPGNKDYGILSVLLQAWYDIEYLFTVEPEVFNPPPKVKSGVIKLTRNNRTSLGCDEVQFKNIIKTAFNQRRKILRNSLKSIYGKDNIVYSLPIFLLRPEQLSVEDFIELTNLSTEQKL